MENTLQPCSFCYTNPCAARVCEASEVAAWEKYCVECLPFLNAPEGSHADLPQKGEYLFVYFDHHTPYIAQVIESQCTEGVSLLTVLYAVEGGKGIRGHLEVVKGRMAAMEGDGTIRRAVRWWNRKRGIGWWKAAWKTTACLSAKDF